ncbi:hypothetical protein EEL32_25040 [Brevibacillus laterosporus]|nr:hypothetical protein [Brevibacillus laterosporus]TPG67858.1 hypothetical protein EEL31_04265 [Brevibacillus laterosporus]TPG74444.1 hypothetical protein EEL32_25040 [Brevibacillus laterosporus]
MNYIGKHSQNLLLLIVGSTFFLNLFIKEGLAKDIIGGISFLLVLIVVLCGRKYYKQKLSN